MPLMSKEEQAQNQEEQQTEKEVLVSIFDDAVKIDDSADQVISIDIRSQYFFIVLRCLLTHFYPSQQPPIFALIEERTEHRIDLSALEKELAKSFVPGEAVIYEWVVYLKEYLEQLDAAVDSVEETVEDVQTFDYSNDAVCGGVENLNLGDTAEFNEFQHNQDWSKNKSVTALPRELEIFTGGLITDRKSHFQGHVCRISSMEEAADALEKLLQNPKIAAATHNIMAYRFRNSLNNICQDFDEDGEQKAGGRLLELLELMKVENIMVVVSRWFGGIQLGPIRFKHINNVAREVIITSGICESENKNEVVKGGKGKKSKK